MAARIRRLLTGLTVLIAGGAAILAVLYLGFGLRLVKTGSGMPWPAFTRAGTAHDLAVEQHRAAQKAAAASTPEPAPAPGAGAAAPTEASAPAAGAAVAVLSLIHI